MDAKQKLKNYLDNRAKEDAQFAEAYANSDKSLDKCIKYIMGKVRKKGSAVWMDDEEIYGLAVHYYDEKDIKVDENADRGAVMMSSDSKVELTEEEKAEARKEAQKRYTESVLQQMQAERAKPKSRKKKAEPDDTTPSLFDL